MSELVIREANIDDSEVILEFIKGLAKYEKMSDLVVASVSDIKENIFNKKYAEVIIGEVDKNPVCFALFFHNFSTFNGSPGLYLEDLFVLEEERSKGYGKKMLEHYTNIAGQIGCERFEWSCLDWNSPAINFYEGLGAVMQKEWEIFRLSGDALINMSNKK